MSFDHDPNQGGGPTHNDAIQILAGTTIHITGNTLLPATSQNAAIQITEDFGIVTDVHIDANFADGGGCTFNFSHKGAASLDGLTTTDNRFGRNSFFDCPILKSTQTTSSRPATSGTTTGRRCRSRPTTEGPQSLGNSTRTMRSASMSTRSTPSRP